jgi:hypothetical protein
MADYAPEIEHFLAEMDRLRKTVLCPPELVADVEALIRQHSPTPGLWTVRPSEFTDGNIYVVNNEALGFEVDHV